MLVIYGDNVTGNGLQNRNQILTMDDWGSHIYKTICFFLWFFLKNYKIQPWVWPSPAPSCAGSPAGTAGWSAGPPVRYCGSQHPEVDRVAGPDILGRIHIRSENQHQDLCTMTKKQIFWQAVKSILTNSLSIILMAKSQRKLILAGQWTYGQILVSGNLVYEKLEYSDGQQVYWKTN